MNIETREIRPADELTDEERASGKWIPVAVPATPLDVEACVNPERLRNLADRILNMADGRADRDPASLRREAEFVRALASALPGMGKDSERLAKLVALVGDKEDRGVVTLGWENGSCCVWAGDDGDFQSGVGAGPDLASAIDNIEMESVDAARAAQPEETKP